MKNKIIKNTLMSILSVVFMSLVVLTPLQVNAEEPVIEKEGYLSYEIVNGEVKITDCDVEASGDFYIPEEIDGYPVTSIGYEAFMGSIGNMGIITPTNITNLYIPKTVKYIDEEAFDACDIEGIYVDEQNELYSSVDGILFSKDKTTLIKCPSGYNKASYTIPSFVKNIEDSAFHLVSGLKNIVISDNVEKLGACAFIYCNGLEEVHLGNGLTQIDSGAFTGCDNLKSVVIPAGVETIGVSMFSNCENLVNVSIADGVKNIGDRAFERCIRLTHIEIPSSIESVGENAFSASRLWHIFYGGTEEEWKQIEQPNVLCAVHFNSAETEIVSDVVSSDSDDERFKEKCSICSKEKIFHVNPPTLGFINMKENEDIELDECVSYEYHCIDEWTEIKAATCKEYGVGEGSCSYYGCAGSGEIELPKLNHDYQVVEIAREAKPELYGIRVVRCSGCGNEKRETYEYEEVSDSSNKNDTDTKADADKSNIDVVVGASVVGVFAASTLSVVIIKHRKRKKS